MMYLCSLTSSVHARIITECMETLEVGEASDRLQCLMCFTLSCLLRLMLGEIDVNACVYIGELRMAENEPMYIPCAFRWMHIRAYTHTQAHTHSHTHTYTHTHTHSLTHTHTHIPIYTHTYKCFIFTLFVYVYGGILHMR